MYGKGCNAVAGTWAGVRAMTNIPSKEIVEETGADILAGTTREWRRFHWLKLKPEAAC
jgi:hypothetical protein